MSDTAAQQVPTHRLEGSVNAMEKLVMSLCPSCSHCPEVAIEGDTVSIGEAPNITVLKKDEWNVLVSLIQSGQLGAL